MRQTKRWTLWTQCQPVSQLASLLLGWTLGASIVLLAMYFLTPTTTPPRADLDRSTAASRGFNEVQTLSGNLTVLVPQDGGAGDMSTHDMPCSSAQHSVLACAFHLKVETGSSTMHGLC